MSVRMYFEDIEVGAVTQLGQRLVTREEIIDFARQFDPQPFHLTDEGGRQSPFGALCASGWHTSALVHRLSCDTFMGLVHSVGSPGLDELKWLRPLFPGDTLSARVTILEKRPSASRPSIGLVKSVTEAFNQDGADLMRLIASFMVLRRP